jgi:hypothetical protein
MKLRSHGRKLLTQRSVDEADLREQQRCESTEEQRLLDLGRHSSYSSRRRATTLHGAGDRDRSISCSRRCCIDRHDAGRRKPAVCRCADIADIDSGIS